MSNVSIFHLPNRSLFGAGCLKEIGRQAAGFNIKRFLLVTDNFLAKSKACRHIHDLLKNEQIEITLFDKTSPNPTLQNVYDAHNLFVKTNCGGVISLGGGSSHDCAKAVSILATNSAPLEQYEGVDKFPHKGSPLITINTTAGTASEITNCFIITNTATNTKLIFEGVSALADIAVNDPELMLSLPAGLTASTGMDALTHAVECYVSTLSFKLTNDLALLAVRYIFQNLSTAVQNPDDLNARENMIYGEYIAGMAFGNGGVGIVHAIAHALGGIYDLPHGLCNAILLPHVIRYNTQICAARYADLYTVIAPAKSKGMSANAACEAFVAEVENLSHTIGTDRPLHTLGVQKEDFDKIAAKALLDSCCETNPIFPKKEDIIQILNNAF
ncbi:iron-containing alcohol dehydrogenase [Mediterraneibacter massiliensis]|jgi:alcohol dehydrogenase|uniref:iron-containing alcohol dehydrogenase n=1 Tax=Mediterraneibacter massiliensis TaxID=1720300 RepID=UPI000E50137E|nr:iron-containing alcohol dehydrogenase [Mediterraneibacter massiliensis]RGT74956.1 iron-containing alcohol dehydrogenase [Ruminococcus sp. AF18-22]